MVSVIAEWPASSPQLDKLFEAKSKALGSLRNAPRTSKSHFGMYADLATVWDTIRKPLSDNGLDVIQTFAPYDEQHVILVTTLGHSSGQFIRSFLPIKSSLQPQQLAATATYLKRVELAAIVGVAAEDEDDGETAQRAAIGAQAADAERVEKALMSKVRAARDAAGIDAVIQQVDRGRQSGQLANDAADRVIAYAEQVKAMNAKQAKPAKQEAVVAT